MMIIICWQCNFKVQFTFLVNHVHISYSPNPNVTLFIFINLYAVISGYSQNREIIIIYIFYSNFAGKNPLHPLKVQAL